MLFIVVLSGKTKFGSLGEYVTKDAISNIPATNITIPKISASLLSIKLINKLAVFFISI